MLSNCTRTKSPEISPMQELIDEINNMFKVDQEMRNTALDHGKPWDPSVDERNTIRMKEIVREHGWPGASLVGVETAHNAWYLVQHADHDVDFQERCIGLMKLCQPGEVQAVEIAYLEDRIKVNRGQPQVYGTQGRPTASGDWDVCPIEVRAQVDDRRAKVGLEPLNQYLLFMNTRYGRASG